MSHIRFVAPTSLLGIELLNLDTDLAVERFKVASSVDLVVVQREAAAHPHAFKLREFTRKRGIPFVFDLDDLLFSLPRLHPDRQKSNFVEALLPMFRLLLESDVVTVCNDQLKQLVEKLNPNTYVLPNYIDDTVWEIREYSRNDGVVQILYFGTQSHDSDLAEIQPAILQVLRVLGDRVRFKVVGFAPSNSLRPLSLEDNVTFDQIFEHDYVKFVYKANKIHAHIGIAPLSNNLFNQSKSALKFLEYTCMGLAGVYSNIRPYSNEVYPGRNGFLASSIQEWIDSMLALARDEDLRLSIVRAARERLHDFRLSVHAQNWKRQIEEVVGLASSANCRARSSSWQLMTEALKSIDVQLRDHCNKTVEETLEKERRKCSKAVEAALERERQKSREIEEEILNCLTSKSWKLTRPLRWSYQMLSRLTRLIWNRVC